MAYFNSKKGAFLSEPSLLLSLTYRDMDKTSPYLYNNEDVMLSGSRNSTHKPTNFNIENESMEDQKKEHPHKSLSVA
jgi:hypothetical protein